jgi:NAD-dependent SIR2 family protein deacetylase
MKNPFSKKNNCIQCKEKFSNHEDLVKHVRHIHHKTIVKCQKCGKEFIHEKDRLHHARKEHEEEMRERSHRSSYPEEYGDTQDRVNRHTSHFDDKL